MGISGLCSSSLCAQDDGRLGVHLPRPGLRPQVRGGGEQRLHVPLHRGRLHLALAQVGRRDARRRDRLCVRAASQSEPRLQQEGDRALQTDHVVLGQLR